MTADYTRDTHKPAKQYSGVRLQQGRVQLDADWNEHVDIAHHLARTTTGDVVGRTGVPEAAPGFGVEAVTEDGAADLLIGPGRAYVEGVLVELAAAGQTTLTKVSGSGTDTVWEVSAGPRLLSGQWLDRPQGQNPARLRVAEVLAPAEEHGGRQRVRLSKAIGGGTKTVTARVSLSVQPHLPEAELPQSGHWHLVYLDVWEREITALDDPEIREVALNGPDTAARTQIAWQVRTLDLDPLIAAGTLGDPPVCKAFGPGWSPHGDAAPVRLAARAKPGEDTPDPCALPATGGYRSLENHLYRVEVHRGGQAGSEDIAVKWSRDNAIHRARLLDVKDGSLIVDSVGKDHVTAFKTDDWLEVRDHARLVSGQPGFFVRLGEINDTSLGIVEILHPETLQPLTDNGEPDTDVLPKTGTVRRWEGGKPVPLATGTWLALENGIEVQLAAGLARVGDYWLAPARSLTARLEWPADPATGEAAFAPPAGIRHRFMALAVAERQAGGQWTVREDCRDVFPPLTRLESMFYVGGDGQEAMPDPTRPNDLVRLGSALAVGVARGRAPVAGRLVRFRVIDNNNKGRIEPADIVAAADVVVNTGVEVVLRTNAEGLAPVDFRLNPKRARQHVLAELLDTSDPAQAARDHLPIHFTANLSIAAEVAYDPARCDYQKTDRIEPGTTVTVQDAIDKLCPPVDFVKLGGDGQGLCVGDEARAPLRVGLYWNRTPLSDVTVKFGVIAGEAKLVPELAKTNAEGVAEVQVVGGGDPLSGGGVVVVAAKPADAPGRTLPETQIFTLRYLNAECVYVDKNVCPDGQREMKSNTVAALLQYLCERGAGEDPGIHVNGIFFFNEDGKETPLRRNGVVLPELLLRGLRFDFDQELDPRVLTGTARRAPSMPGRVIFDMPFPSDKEEAATMGTTRRGNSGLGDIGDLPVALDARFFLTNDAKDRRNHALFWRPEKSTITWMANSMMNQLQEFFRQPFVSARAELFGNQIWAAKSDKLVLDGELFPDARSTAGVHYPSGDGKRGGDLVLPFFCGKA